MGGKQGGVVSWDRFVLLTADSRKPEVLVLVLATHHHLLQSLQPDGNMDSGHRDYK